MKLNLGHLGSQTRSLGQVKEIPFGHSKAQLLPNGRENRLECLSL